MFSVSQVTLVCLSENLLIWLYGSWVTKIQAFLMKPDRLVLNKSGVLQKHFYSTHDVFVYYK